MIETNKINQNLHSIANVLLLNTSLTHHLGLLNGKMGMAIFFYHYARYAGNDVYKNHADKLLDEMYAEIGNLTTMSFAEGLTGIGWGIEHLIQNKFIEGDTDEILEEVDMALFTANILYPILTENSDDFLGAGLYALARLKGEGIVNTPTCLVKKQRLLSLLDRCENILVYKRFLEYRIPVFHLTTLNSVAFFLLETYRLDLNPDKIHKLFRYLPLYYEFSVKHFDDRSEIQVAMQLLKRIEPLVEDPPIKQKYITLVNILAQTQAPNEASELLVNHVPIVFWQKLIYKNLISVDSFSVLFKDEN